MSEFERLARTAHEGESPDLRRLEVARRRFGSRIDEGIAKALDARSEIEPLTAQCIAHVLGRALGRGSVLANYGRTREGDYADLRDEYLALYGDERVDPESRELIDWFGAFLIHRDGLGSGRRFMNEHLPPKLGHILVRANVPVDGSPLTVHVPGTCDGEAIASLEAALAELSLPGDEALQAFLAMPDVDATSDAVLRSFQEAFAGTFDSEEGALRALSPLQEWEQSLADWQVRNAVDPESLRWNYAPLIERLREIYDLVEREGHVHAFVR